VLSLELAFIYRSTCKAIVASLIKKAPKVLGAEKLLSSVC